MRTTVARIRCPDCAEDRKSLNSPIRDTRFVLSWIAVNNGSAQFAPGVNVLNLTGRGVFFFQNLSSETL